MRDFYRRRILRIFPAYFSYLAAVFLITIFTANKLSSLQWISSLSFTVNYAQPPWIIGHLWSLSVEEQFYLIWPFLLILLTRDKISPLKIIVVLMAPVLIAPIFRIFGYIRPWSILFGKHSFFTCWDSLAIGCILAVLLFSYGRQIEDVFKNRIVLPLVFGILLIVFPIIITRLRVLGFFSVPFTITFNAAGVAILIGSSLLRPNLFKFLDVKLLVSVGIGSYSIYLWQQLFCANPPLFVMPKTPWLMGFPFWVISALGVASFSYIFIEKPFLKLKPSIKTG